MGFRTNLSQGDPSVLEQRIHSWLGRRYFRFKLLPDKHANFKGSIYVCCLFTEFIHWEVSCFVRVYADRSCLDLFETVPELQCRSAVWPKRRSSNQKVPWVLQKDVFLWEFLARIFATNHKKHVCSSWRMREVHDNYFPRYSMYGQFTYTFG